MKTVAHNVEAWNPASAQWQVWENFPSRKAARENEEQIKETLLRDLKITPLTIVVPAHKSQSPPFARSGAQPVEKHDARSRNPFSYFFEGHDSELEELRRLGIHFCAIDLGGGEKWPGFVLPSGKLLGIACDPEGNGPGAIHIFDKE